MYCLGITPPTILSARLEAASPGEWLYFKPCIAKLSTAAGLFLILTLNLRFSLNRFLVGDLGHTQGDLNPEFPFQAFHSHLNMDLTLFLKG